MLIHFANRHESVVLCATVRVHTVIQSGDNASSDPDKVTCESCRALLLGEGSLSHVDHLRQAGAM